MKDYHKTPVPPPFVIGTKKTWLYMRKKGLYSFTDKELKEAETTGFICKNDGVLLCLDRKYPALTIKRRKRNERD